MVELTEIAKGWYRYEQASEDVKRRMLKRLAICDTCPHKMQNRPNGQRLPAGADNLPDSLYRCGQCNCPLAGLVPSLTTQCKIRKW